MAELPSADRLSARPQTPLDCPIEPWTDRILGVDEGSTHRSQDRARPCTCRRLPAIERDWCIAPPMGHPEALWFELCRQGSCVEHGVILLLGFSRRDIPDRLQKPSMVEPVHPFGGFEFDSFEVSPWAAPLDDLGLLEAFDRFHESVIANVADAADGRFDARFR